MFVKNFSHKSRAHISKSKRRFNLKSPTYYFHMKTKMLADFQICISEPLSVAQCFQVRIVWNSKFDPQSWLYGNFI